jgi:hypothetical protein
VAGDGLGVYLALLLSIYTGVWHRIFDSMNTGREVN